MAEHKLDADGYQRIIVILLIIIAVLVVSLINVSKQKTAVPEGSPVVGGGGGQEIPLQADKTSPETPAVTTQTTPAPQPQPKITCKDVTSYDHNWNNDVFCTRADGSTFYTNYAGGRAADPTFER